MALSTSTIQHLIELHTKLPVVPVDGGGISLGGWVRIATVDRNRRRPSHRPDPVTVVLADISPLPCPECLSSLIGAEIHTRYDALQVVKAYAEAEGAPFEI